MKSNKLLSLSDIHSVLPTGFFIMDQTDQHVLIGTNVTIQLKGVLVYVQIKVPVTGETIISVGGRIILLDNLSMSKKTELTSVGVKGVLYNADVE